MSFSSTFFMEPYSSILCIEICFWFLLWHCSCNQLIFKTHGPLVTNNLDHLIHKKEIMIFSSPELKAQVSFSDHLSSILCLSVRPSIRLSICLSVRLSVNFSHFHLLLQNHWAKFNQTWDKASLGEGDSLPANEEPIISHKVFSFFS